jgi:cellobiose phosphorylase
MAGLCAHIGQEELREEYFQQAAAMEAVVLQHGWDGDWFRRAYNDFGQPIGSKTCEEGQIFIEPQGICIMAGIGLNDGRAKKALASVRERLATPHGIVVQQPAYSHYYLELGEISSYPPGYKENASIFCHTNPWIMIAEVITGNADQALDYYLRINPSAREEISEVHRCEPYIYCQTIAGRDAATHGEAKNSWLTGTAAWNYVAVTQWILGIQPTYQGLRISPSIPDSWEGFEVSRLFRGVMYHINVRRVGRGNAIQMTCDGKIVSGNTIPLTTGEQKEVQVVVRIGV